MSSIQESIAQAAQAVGRSWWVILLYGIVGVIFGIMAIMRPMEAAVALAWAAGIMALVEAVISFFALFSKDAPVSKGWLLFYAVISAIFGVLAIMNPMIMAGSLVIVLGLWLIIAGIYRIVFAIRVRKVIDGEWWMILAGVLGILLGVMFIAEPVAGVVTSALWIGILAQVYGIFQIMASFRIRKLAK